MDYCTPITPLPKPIRKYLLRSWRSRCRVFVPTVGTCLLKANGKPWNLLPELPALKAYFHLPNGCILSGLPLPRALIFRRVVTITVLLAAMNDRCLPPSIVLQPFF